MNVNRRQFNGLALSGIAAALGWKPAMDRFAHHMRILTPACFAASASGGRWLPARHLLHIDRAIVRAISEGSQVLVIESPPRHGKSELISKWLPAWYLGSYPDRRVMLASYEAKFARTWGLKAQQVLRHHGPDYFGVEVSRLQAAANDWKLVGYDGGMTTAGIGGPLTGRGADLLIIDDPIKNPKEAMSETVRELHWDWLQSTATTRLEPGGVLVVMATRWHHDDLIGRIISRTGETGRPVRRIHLPAIAGDNDELGREPGEALWPYRWPLGELELIRLDKDEYWWQSLYQQNPGQHGLTEWPADYFEPAIWADTWPDAFESVVLAIDPSKGKNARRGDYSAIVSIGLAGGIMWVDCSLERRPVAQLCEDVVDWSMANNPDHVGVESNGFQELIQPELDAVTRRRQVAPLPIALINNTVNKVLRISRLGSYLRPERRMFRFRDTPGCRLLVQQLRSFPFADHDDGPDGLEMGVRLLRWATAGPAEQEQYLQAG